VDPVVKEKQAKKAYFLPESKHDHPARSLVTIPITPFQLVDIWEYMARYM
jgi:hypothetical protein